MTQIGKGVAMISVVFHKPVESWSDDDRREILARLRKFILKAMKPPAKRKAKKVALVEAIAEQEKAA
jgi:hypothetical protein